MIWWVRDRVKRGKREREGEREGGERERERKREREREREKERGRERERERERERKKWKITTYVPGLADKYVQATSHPAMNNCRVNRIMKYFTETGSSRILKFSSFFFFVYRMTRNTRAVLAACVLRAGNCLNDPISNGTSFIVSKIAMLGKFPKKQLLIYRNGVGR